MEGLNLYSRGVQATFEGSRFLGPETNIFAPEKQWLENRISISHNIHVWYMVYHLSTFSIKIN